MRAPTYVQYGCGFSVAEGWLNFDSSPTLRLERLPVVGGALSSLVAGNGARFPASVRFGDICKGLPVEDGAVRGCYASHVLEHLSVEDLREALANTFRMLEPGGTFRLIVPDLHARARRYVEAADRGSASAASEFMTVSHLGYDRRPRSVTDHLRHAIGNSRHLWMWDEHAMTAELERAGFVRIRRCDFGDAADPMFAKVEERSRFFDEGLGIAECALEAATPGG